MEQVVAYVVSALMGITAVGAFISKLGSAKKYLSLASEVIGFVDLIIKSVEDKNISEDEVKKIAAECKEIKEAYNLIRKKNA